MTKEKISAFQQYLEDHKESNSAIFESSAEDALKELNKTGAGFTIEDLKEIATAFDSANLAGELSEEQLDNVAGGILVETALVALALSAAGLGYKIGSDLAKKYGW